MNKPSILPSWTNIKHSQCGPKTPRALSLQTEAPQKTLCLFEWRKCKKKTQKSRSISSQERDLSLQMEASQQNLWLYERRKRKKKNTTILFNFFTGNIVRKSYEQEREMEKKNLFKLNWMGASTGSALSQFEELCQRNCCNWKQSQNQITSPRSG